MRWPNRVSKGAISGAVIERYSGFRTCWRFSKASQSNNRVGLTNRWSDNGLALVRAVHALSPVRLTGLNAQIINRPPGFSTRSTSLMQARASGTLSSA